MNPKSVFAAALLALALATGRCDAGIIFFPDSLLETVLSHANSANGPGHAFESGTGNVYGYLKTVDPSDYFSSQFNQFLRSQGINSQYRHGGLENIPRGREPDPDRMDVQYIGRGSRSVEYPWRLE